MGSERIRVLIADDHAVLRAGLRLLLDAQPDMVVVGEAETAEQAMTLDADLRPDVVLMDLALPLRPGDPNTVPSGLEAIRRIMSERPEARILALTMYDDEGYLRAVLEAGGAGYVLKQAADMLCLSVKTVETYKSRLMTKLDLTGRAALVRYALQRGLLEEQE